jgi:hypothetical protein
VVSLLRLFNDGRNASPVFLEPRKLDREIRPGIVNKMANLALKIE